MARSLRLNDGRELNPAAFYGRGVLGICIRTIDAIRLFCERKLVRWIGSLHAEELLLSTKPTEVTLHMPTEEEREAARPKPLTEANIGSYVADLMPDRAMRHRQGRSSFRVVDFDDR